MKRIVDTLPWTERMLPPCPFAHEGYFGFNPSIHRQPDGQLLCVVRCADYCRPNSIPQMKRPGRIDTRNVMLAIDPDTLEVIAIREIAERDGARRLPAVTSGFEDVRLFRTAQHGLVAIATTLQLRGGSNAEMVFLRFDDEYNIVAATPIRGAFPGSWSDFPQKNWSPFDGADEPRFLFSIERGVLFDVNGPIRGETGHEAPAETPRPMGSITYNGGVETRVEPTFVMVDRATGQEAPKRRIYDWTPGGLRGGSQLVPLGDGRWLGIAHGVVHRTGGMHVIPNYWHVWHVCDDDGKLLARSEPMKLSDKGIELAMGLAIDVDRDRAIVSYGVEDMEARLGVTSLSAVLELLGVAPARPLALPAPADSDPTAITAAEGTLGNAQDPAAPPGTIRDACPHCGQPLPNSHGAQRNGVEPEARAP